MTSVLFRTASGPVNSSLLTGSPRFSVPLRYGSFSSCEKFEFSPLLHFHVNNNRRRISRALSEPHFVDRCFDRMSWISANGIAVEEPQFPGGSGRRDGFGSGGSTGNSNNNDNNNEWNKIEAHYQKMLKSNPNDPLLLRNYSKFLHEVEGDTVKAEEYYGRAILANPGDGELLSLYGKLIWDTQRHRERAKSYFDQAVVASPDDCMVMGSYAQFMWEEEEEEEEEEDEESGSNVSVPTSQPLVATF